MKLSIITLNEKYCDGISDLKDTEIVLVKNNLNNALLNTRGEYICFLGREGVIWSPDKTERQIKTIETHGLSFIGTSVQIIYNNKSVRIIDYPESHEECYKEFYRYKNNFVFDDSVIFRRCDAVQVGGFSIFIKDSEKESKNAFCLSLWCRMMLVGKKCGNIQDPLVSCTQESFLYKNEYIEEKKLLWGMFKRKTFQIKSLNDKGHNSLFEFF